ncbi:MAG: hypothetical protein ACP5E3_07230 [Bacteroidales bacterium]
MRPSFHPLGVFINRFEQELKPGLEIEVPVILINDLNEPYELDFTILWSNDSGEEAPVTESISMTPLEKRDLLYKLKTPDSEGRYELIARFEVDDETISSRGLCSITRIP